MNRKSIKEWVMNIGAIVLTFSIPISCGVGMALLGNEERVNDENRLVIASCTAHFHNAAKALTVESAHNELAQAELCLYLHQDLCEETPELFSDKMMVVHSLKKRLETQPIDRATEEAMLQSVGRVLFDGGQYCYKGNCKLKTYPFMCSDVKDSSRHRR